MLDYYPEKRINTVLQALPCGLRFPTRILDSVSKLRHIWSGACYPHLSSSDPRRLFSYVNPPASVFDVSELNNDAER